jgi:TRAP-type mannitol/chloroaromatic compound transport system permease small subunit
MPKAVVTYVRWVDNLNYGLGRVVMYMIFVMIAILFWSSVSKTFFLPSLWTLEMAQFLMVAYYLLGGGYSLQIDSHVRMDLLYSRWSDKGKARADAITSIFLIFFLGMLLYGSISSTEYAIKYGEKSYSSWAPKMAPIKIIMCIGIFLTLLQAIATFFKDIARIKGIQLGRMPERQEIGS